MEVKEKQASYQQLSNEFEVISKQIKRYVKRSKPKTHNGIMLKATKIATMVIEQAVIFNKMTILASQQTAEVVKIEFMNKDEKGKCTGNPYGKIKGVGYEKPFIKNHLTNPVK